MDVRTIYRDLPGIKPNPSTSDNLPENNATDSESESDVESEEEVQSSDSDASTGDSVKCPICLLKFRGQLIGFPEVCGHPFCLDCILEWSKNAKSCPNDRQKFDNILVRLDLDGEVVRKIPVQNDNKDEEDVNVLDVTECQVCRGVDREDEMLLCDRCDHGYHMDCLATPLHEVPIDDWFCPQCDGTQAVARNRAPLTLRVRRTVQRNRQIALRNSSVGKKKTRKVRKRKTTRRKTTKRKGKRRVRRKKATPSPRKRLADALNPSEKSAEQGSGFSIFGNPNDLFAGSSEDDIEMTPKNKPKSLIAKLAESRKAQKSIYAYGPGIVRSVPAKVSMSSSSANPDLLGSILASQSQLTNFGKAPEEVARPKRNTSSRVLAAILASRATLSLLDNTLISYKKNADQTNTTSNGSIKVAEQSTGQQSNGQAVVETHNTGASGNGSGGSGEEPNGQPPKKLEPEDKKDEVEEEDVDLYSDIESVDEEQERPVVATKIEEEPPIPEEDDEKGLVIDDTAESGRRSTESVSDQAENYSPPIKPEKTETLPAKPVYQFQHGGLPAAAAALTIGPKGGVISRPQLQRRTINDCAKETLVSTIASALTSALLAQSLAPNEEQLPPATYSSSPGKSAIRKRKMEEIFGGDMEQVSDCEEGELDESEEELPGNRIVRMLTPETKDCEEGEIVDKKKREECQLPDGERRVEVSIEDESIPSTFKKLDSGKTRHYRHQGDIKVVEGKKKETRRVVKRRSRSKEKKKSRKKSSSSSSMSSLSPERRKGKENKRSSSSGSDLRKKKKSKKKKKKSKHKKTVESTDHKVDPDDIEIPSKAVFASGDKIVVSLHFGSTGTSTKTVAKKKKRKSESKESSTGKRVKEEEIKKPKVEEIKKSKPEEPKKKPEKPKEKPEKPKEPVRKPELPVRGGAGRGRGMRPRIRRGKPVLIDIETSREIPLDDPRPSDIIVLSDDDLPPLPPEPVKKAAEPVKKPGNKPAVKFSFTSKANSIKLLNNPLLLAGDDDEEEEVEQPEAVKIPIIEHLPEIAIPLPPKAPSPIFNLTYDPSNPTHTPSPEPIILPPPPLFPLPHPAAVLMPPMTSLPPPPLPPPLLTGPPPYLYNTSVPPPPIPPPLLLNAPIKRPTTPPSPTPSEGSDIFGPPSPCSPQEPVILKSKTPPSGRPATSNFDSLFQQQPRKATPVKATSSKPTPTKSSKSTPVKNPAAGTSAGPAFAVDGVEECPSSAVELQVKEKFLKKLNRQERVVEEVRIALKPYYTTKRISKGDYKEILRKCVPKICHTKSGEINPIKIKEMVKGYVKKFRYHHKKEVVAH